MRATYPRACLAIPAGPCMCNAATVRAMNIQVPEGPAHVVTGVELDARGEVRRVRWYLADGGEVGLAAGAAPRPLSGESVVDTLEVVDKLLEAEPVVPLFPGRGGAVTRLRYSRGRSRSVRPGLFAGHSGP